MLRFLCCGCTAIASSLPKQRREAEQPLSVIAAGLHHISSGTAKRLLTRACPPAPRAPQDTKRDYRHVLSRSALLEKLSASNLLSMVPPEVRQLYELLTSDFNPLELCAQLAPRLEALANINTPMSAASPRQNLCMATYVRTLKQVRPGGRNADNAGKRQARKLLAA